MLTPDAHAVASSWVAKAARGLEEGSIEAFLDCILPNGFLRDILIFTWDNRTIKGHAAMFAFLKPTLANARIANVCLDERQHLSPAPWPLGPDKYGVSTGFIFETSIAKGQGYAWLLQDERGEWKALSVFTMMDQLKGYEEKGPESGVYGGHTIAWGDVREERRQNIESDPHVIIVGGGQTGLNVGSRFKQMGIPSIILEQNARVGDVWRKRYPTLTLHTPRPHHSMNYQPFPDTWPRFTPRDKLADWLEQYAVSQDLIVWTNSTLAPVPTYDATIGRWTCTVLRNGAPVILQPAHIVLACGTLGAPFIPSISTLPMFEGPAVHASSYHGGKPFKDKRVAVIGAGNTSADICQDLVYHGAKSVMMVQRSSTTVQSVEKTAGHLQAAYPLDVPVAISDFKASSMPFAMLRELALAAPEDPNDMDREMREKMTAKGLKLSKGRDGSGQFFLVFERFGGYWLDIGVADLIDQGKITIKQGVEISRCTPKSVVFTDEAEHEVDAIIFATGYHSILESYKTIFGEKVVSKTPHIWGFDEEQEIRGSYRPSGQPGLWYASGDFYNSRFFGKQLALEIKAIELGYMKQ